MAPVAQILFLSTKPDKMDEFPEADRNFLASATLPKGFVGSRLYRNPDGKSAVRMVQYESVEAHKADQQDEALQQQIAPLRSFVDSAAASLYEQVRTAMPAADV